MSAREARRARLTEHDTVIGLDFVEPFGQQPPWTLRLHLVPNNAARTRRSDLRASNLAIRAGGRTARGLRVTAVALSPDQATAIDVTLMVVGVDPASRELLEPTYQVALTNCERVDPFFVEADFRLDDPPDLDPSPDTSSVAVAPTSHVPDYLARSYEAIRAALLDRMAVRVPSWTDRDPADPGVTVIEALAAAADALGYYQEAVATEAYPATARRRVSLRRHGRLRDALPNEGRNARVLVGVEVTAPIEVPAGTPIAVAQANLPTAVDRTTFRRLVPMDAVVFETVGAQQLAPTPETAAVYAWGAPTFQLQAGATEACVVGGPKVYPQLRAGSFVVFVQVCSPTSGLEEEADPRRRWAVRLVADPELVVDDLYDDLQLSRLRWSREDALPWAMPIQAVIDGRQIVQITQIGVNLLLADHGRTVTDDGKRYRALLDQRIGLSQANITFTAGVPAATDSASKVFSPGIGGQPALTVVEILDALRLIDPNDPLGQPVTRSWTARPDLLGSTPWSTDYVVEVEEDRTVTLRFGDGVYGRAPADRSKFHIRYRVGSGAEGNVGADRVVHIGLDDEAARSAVLTVRNPLPSHGGRAPEGLDAFRRRSATTLRQELRCVTEDDYARRARSHPEVRDAVAILTSTGTFSTMRVYVDRAAGLDVDEAFRDEIEAWLDGWRMAGVAIEVQGPRWVPLDVALTLSVASSARASVVAREVARVLDRIVSGASDQRLTGFGVDLYLSVIVRGVFSVPDVVDVVATSFRRVSDAEDTATVQDAIAIGPSEIALVLNDPEAPELGRLRLTLEGGL